VSDAPPDQGDYRPEIATATEVRPLTATERLFHLILPHRALGHLPGQFVQVSLPGIGEAPISVSSSFTRTSGFDLCIRRTGNVSEALHRVKAGGRVGIRGPFGCGAPLEKCMGQDVLMIAGGLGLAPLRSLVQYICDYRDRFKKVTLLIGARTPETLLFADEYNAWRNEGKINIEATVDTAKKGWTGSVGLITNLIPQIEIWPTSTVVVACGPPIMYRFVMRKLQQRHIPDDRIYLSLERRMKCGMGKCGHCQINDVYVCLDGPVFRYDRLAALPEAVS